jgi:glycosyltransferase 2 family protein
MVINTLAGIRSTIGPTRGGMGVMDGGPIAGMTAAGIPASAAIPAVITSRMSTCYLPPIWGYPALLWLRKDGYV